MKVSDYIANFLFQKGVKTIFGYQGGMITHVIDSLGNHPNIDYIQCYHEQTASIAAEGYAKETGRLGCAVSSSGPGVTNMMTGIADAFFDNVPVLYITGQVNTYEYKYDKLIRQQGFQEMEVANLVSPITKYAKMLDVAEEVPYELEKAVYMAFEGRKGPVLLDIPLNIQRSNIDPERCNHYLKPHTKLEVPKLNDVFSLVRKSHHPMLLLGAGCNGSNEMLLIRELLRTWEVPVVTSLMGRSSLTEDYKYHMGMVGSYGNRSANMAVSQADLLIVLGSRLDTRQTGARLDAFIPESTIIHVNEDVNELKCHRLPNRVTIHSKVDTFLQEFITGIVSIELPKIEKWHQFLEETRSNYNQKCEIARFVDNKTPYFFIDKLNSYTKPNDIVISDIGQNQMWVAQTIRLKKDMKYFTSGGLAPMGYAMPTAIGCAFASPFKTIYAICGDGAFHMSTQSLGVIAQHKLPIKIVIMNNNCLGMINQFQRLYFDSRFYGTHPTYGFQNPSYEDMANAYGLQYFKISENDLSNKELMQRIFECKTCIIECMIEGYTSVCPKLEYDKPLSKPMPMLNEEEYNKAFSILN